MAIKNLLPPSDYTVSKAIQKNRINALEKFKDTLINEVPTFVDAEVDGYKIIGKTAKFQQYIAEKDDNLFSIQLKRAVGATATTTGSKVLKEVSKKLSPIKDLSSMNLQTKRLIDAKFDPSDFIPMKSNTPIDFCFSTEGGVMPATNYIVIGDPGIGKSSVTIEHAARIQKENPNKKILFISGEMTEMDMFPFTKRFPLWLHIDILYVSDLTEGMYKESIEAKLKEGYDLVLGDSFAEIADAIRGDYNETVSGVNKKSYNDIEKWLVDLMITHNKGFNDCSKKTSFIFIQQMTKGGTFVGSNKLKHNTTGMLEIRWTKSGDRMLHVVKNRRGFEYDNLHFSFEANPEMPIKYDTDRILRDKKVEQEIKKAANEQLSEENATDEWFKNLGKEVVEDVT